MRSSTAILGLIPLAFAATIPIEKRDAASTCQAIASAVSSASAVFYPGSDGYETDIERWVPSASENSVCSVEPGTVQDVSVVLQILASSTVPFGIKGGGHFADEGVSSTTGVQINLVRINQTTYNADSQTAEIQAGQVWNEVYATLEPLGVNVLGGRLFGVGVPGFLLGGGYSWLSNRHGLAIDSILEYELVLPSGEIVTVNKDSYPDLFFGLKGGYNNFGIVTKFTMPTYPQGQVWGGLINYSADVVPQIIDAVVEFQASSTDVDAACIAGFLGSGGTTSVAVIFFYNGPQPLNGVFDQFLSITSVNSDVSTRSFTDLVVAVSPPFLNTAQLRGFQNSVPLTDITTGMVAEVANQVQLYSSFAEGSISSFSVEPFIKQAVVNADSTATAWPHSNFLSPISSYFFWANAEDDATGIDAMIAAGNAVEAAAVQDAQAVSTVHMYPNYSSVNSTLSDIYGGNVARLQALRQQYDPNGVMARTGGYKF